MFERNRLIQRFRKYAQMMWHRRRGISILALSFTLSLWGLLRFTPALNWTISLIVNLESGTKTEVTNAHWNGWGNLSVESVTLLASTKWPGQSAKIIQVNGMNVTFRPLRLLLGKALVENIHIDSAVINIAERTSSQGEFNLMDLQPRTSSSESLIVLRSATLDNLTIVSLAVSSKNEVTVSGQHTFKGSMTPMANSPIDFEFELLEIPNANPALNQKKNKLKLTGHLNQTSFLYDMQINGLSFDESLLPMLPGSLKSAWKRINLTGSIDEIKISGQPNNPIEKASLTVSKVQANIPIPGDHTEWFRYEPKKLPPLPENIKTASDVKDPPLLQPGLPRMQVDSGTIKFEQNVLKFENFIGKLASTKPRSLPVPLQLDLAITLPKGQQPTSLEDAQIWLDQVFEKSGVEATVQIHNFALTKENEKDFDGVELPKPAVQVLGNLLATTWDIDLDVTISRPPATENASGEFDVKEFTTKGTLNIKNAGGGYFLFPYLLSDVNAQINLYNETLTIAYLHGKGSDGALVNITGTVTNPGDDAGVDLKIKANDLPIDEAMKKSFLFGPKKVFELLYDHAAQNNLIAAGLLKPDEFQFGGRCNVDLRVERAVNGGANVKTTGEVMLRDANVICSRFPYPVHVTSGKIILADTVISLPEEKWKLTTQSKADVTIGGIINIPRDGEDRKVFPDLTITFDNDNVNSLLLAAIPFETAKNSAVVAGWPGKNLSSAARMLKQINLQGQLNGQGKIGANPDESTTWDFTLELARGSITPRQKTTNAATNADQILPDGFDLTDVQAQVRVTDTATSLISLHGCVGDGQVDASGLATLDAKQRWFKANSNNVPIDRWIFGFLPANKRDESMRTWGDCNPTGTLDAEVTLVQNEGQPNHRTIKIDPTNVKFELDSDHAIIEIPKGSIELIDDSLFLHDMRLNFMDMHSQIGFLNANGSINYGATSKDPSQAIAIDANFLFVDSVFFKALPNILQQRLEHLKFQSDGPFQLTNGNLTLSAPNGGVDFSADILLSDAQLNCGPLLTAINAKIKLSSDMSGPLNGMRLDVHDASLCIHSRNINQINGTLITNSSNDNFTIPMLEGELYGGRICLNSVVQGEGTRPWSLNVGVVDSDLAQMIAGGSPTVARIAGDGTFNGMFSLGGEILGDRERVGRGSIEAFGAQLAQLPLSFRLLQITQFMPPISQTLNNAKINFYLHDHTIRFEKFLLSCPTLQLLGSGSLNLDSWDIRMRFKNRGTIPYASALLGAATDFLLAVDVSGSISDPKIVANPLPMLGVDPSKEVPPATPANSKPIATP